MNKIVAVADTHGSTGYIDAVPSCDILLIAGDICASYTESFYQQKAWFELDFIKHLKHLKTKAEHIVFIAGNHDYYLYECFRSKKENTIRNNLPDNVHYLRNNSINVKGLEIYGTPYCLLPAEYCRGRPNWSFSEDEDELQNIYAKIPSDIDVLLTHGPAYGYCDACDYRGAEHLGSKALTDKIENDLKVKYVISGHIHSAVRRESQKDVNFICASVCDDSYKPRDSYEPQIIIINGT